MKAISLARVTGWVSAVLAVGAPVLAAPPTTWSFFLQSTGQNAYWTSPTAVITTARVYDMRYEITRVEVRIRYGILIFWVDVTDQIPPEDRIGEAAFDGPPPITMFDGDIIYPQPPEPPGFRGHVTIWLDGQGFGRMSLTDVYFGQINLPPYGTVTLLGVRFYGTWTVQPLELADLNCDGTSNAFDIDAFVLAVTNPVGYGQAYPNCHHVLADCNRDGAVNAFDIDAFVAIITGG